MKPKITRFSFYLLLILYIGFIPSLYAQNFDSLEATIDKFLNNESIRKNSSARDISVDSVTVMRYLSEYSKLKRINSDSSRLIIMKTLGIALGTGSSGLVSLALQYLGDYFMTREMYKEAMSCYLKSMQIEEKRNDSVRKAEIYGNIGVVYYYMEIFDKSLDYLNKALDIFTAYKDSLKIAGVLRDIGQLHSSREFCESRTEEEKISDFKTAIDYLNRSAALYTQLHNRGGVAVVEQDIAAVYNKMKKPGIALGYVNRSLEYYQEINDPEGISGTLYTLGKTYYRLKEYKKSIEAFKESEEIALERNLTGGIQYLYEALAMPYYDIGDYKNAYNTYIKYMTIRDSVYNAEKSRQLLELETKYQNEIKEKEIQTLTAEKKRRNSLIYALTAVILLLGLSIYYISGIIKKNKIIAAQNIRIKEDQIRELEKERQYLAAKSVIEGEEAERSRLASDLHNGLGGLLSGIKINLSSMKENAVITHENVSALNHAISLLDTSISELRRIAHNLMPETLNHYGLKTALEDFMAQIAQSPPPLITLQVYGETVRYSKEIELTLYRIIQELVNNSLKHASANNINIQLFMEPKRLFAQVTDNGKGFDTKSYDTRKEGKGLANITDRVDALKGKMDLWSQPGQGTEISVEFEID